VPWSLPRAQATAWSEPASADLHRDPERIAREEYLCLVRVVETAATWQGQRARTPRLRPRRLLIHHVLNQIPQGITDSIVRQDAEVRVRFIAETTGYPIAVLKNS
jgi:hypothetical protein